MTRRIPSIGRLWMYDITYWFYVLIMPHNLLSQRPTMIFVFVSRYIGFKI